MGAFLDKPKTDKLNECGEGNGLRFGLSSMQGWRVEMEDAHTAKIGLDADRLKDWSFFAVFDGHAGAKVSGHCSEALLASILNNEDFWGPNSTKKIPDFENVKKGIRKGFLQFDAQMKELPEFLSGDEKSGSTAVIGIISPTHVFFGNCGDSRGVLSRGGEVVLATTDHKPMNETEKSRITAAGGSVMIQRVNGSLAVSRALGDYEYKNNAQIGPCEQLVSPEPEITAEDRSPKDEFLVLACDGIWDVMSNEEVCDFIRNRMALTDDLGQVANQVVDTCLYKGSRDNMSIVIVAFEGAPKVSEEAKKKEAELDARLEGKIKGFLQQSDPSDVVLPYVMHLLTLEEIEGLPPGGGLISKRTKIEQILNEFNPGRNETE